MREAPGWSVQSREATSQLPAKRTLLIGTFDFEQTAPASLREGIPA
jgi:hypothetical protein